MITRAEVARQHGLLLRQIREEAGLSRLQLGALARVHTETIRRIETGKNSVSINLLDQLLAPMGYELEFVKK